MKTDDELKKLVNEKYSEIAASNQGCACGCGCSDSIQPMEYSIMSDDYSLVDGYYSEADLGLGCGMPTEFANIKSGDTVLDLGSGAGNDVFIARREVGRTGKVIGLDFSQDMLVLAQNNCTKLGYSNVEFINGDIEDMPVASDTVDVVISNCVLNLVPNKSKAFSEIYRVLKPNAHFCVSDIVINGDLPSNISQAASMYAGCVAGAMQKQEYLKLIEDNGFRNVEIVKSKPINVPQIILKAYLNEEEMQHFESNPSIIESITIKAVK